MKLDETRPTRPTFCTVVDLNYLPRAVALYRSLEEVCPQFRLHVVCMEPGIESLLHRLELPLATTQDIGELEGTDPDLRAVKGTRSRAEYCWTAKPSLCVHLLEQGLDVVTYVDSDLLFFEDPRIVLGELCDSSIMILPHRFPPRWADWGKTDGAFNGAWLTFRRDHRALAALRWWRERCLEWCYDRREDGKYADQRYLDDWPERFEGVQVIAHPGAGLAPWNARQYELERRQGVPLVDGQRAVFYHYQSLRLVRAPPGLRSLTSRLGDYRPTPAPGALLWWTAPEYELSDREVELFWLPYLRRLIEALSELRRADPSFEGAVTSVEVGELGLALARRVLPSVLRRRLRRVQLAIQRHRL
jgi:hypothetical protein